jgi:hypothetical protein
LAGERKRRVGSQARKESNNTVRVKATATTLLPRARRAVQVEGIATERRRRREKEEEWEKEWPWAEWAGKRGRYIGRVPSSGALRHQIWLLSPCYFWIPSKYLRYLPDLTGLRNLK